MGRVEEKDINVSAAAFGKVAVEGVEGQRISCAWFQRAVQRVFFDLVGKLPVFSKKKPVHLEEAKVG